jgi:hypothetical protein
MRRPSDGPAIGTRVMTTQVPGLDDDVPVMWLRQIRHAAVVLAISFGALSCQGIPPRVSLPPGPSPAPRAPASHHVTTGVYVPDPSYGLSAWGRGLDQYDADAGARPSIVQWYVPWSSNAAFPAVEASLVRSRSQTPFITWEAWDWSGGANQPAYALREVLAGRYDSYITAWARGAREYGSVVYLRVFAEANGNWNPWDPGVNGNTASEYVQAWRHVWNIFHAVGASNVVWLWTPVVEYTGSTPLASIYPGDSYLDMVGLDGYNWGTTMPWSSWQSFSTVFDPSIARLRALTAKPLWITEVGSAERGGSKAYWITDALRTIGNDSRISGFVWFNANKETDWRIESSPAAIAAYRAGIRALR